MARVQSNAGYGASEGQVSIRVSGEECTSPRYCRDHVILLCLEQGPHGPGGRGQFFFS